MSSSWSPTASPDLAAVLRRARLAQAATVAWMLVEGGVALAAGLAARSIVLTAFGFDSLVEIVTAAVVLRRLLQRSPDESRGSLGPGERRASRLVGWALWALVAYIVISAAASLLLGFHAGPSPVGVALTLASLAIMLPLWRWRLRLADALGSPALRADAACSAVCIYLAAIALVGLVLNQLLGWWWADPLAALLFVWWVQGEAREALEASASP